MKHLTDEQLLEFYENQANEMSYYNAAEGQSWYEERPARLACKAELTAIAEEIKERGIELPKGNWLI